MKPPRLPLRAPLLALATLVFAACESGPDRKALMEEAHHSVPPMAAQESFFDGQIVVHLSLGGMAEGGPISRDEGHGGLMGMSNIPTSFGGAGNFGEVTAGDQTASGPRNIYEGKPDDHSSEYEVLIAQRRSEFQMPSALLRLRLENTSQATVIVEVRQLNSALGNFAVRPDVLTLAPSQSAEPEAMQSRLGLDTFELPVTVTLRAGGTTETKIMVLHLVKPASVSPPPSSPPLSAPPPAHTR